MNPTIDKAKDATRAGLQKAASASNSALQRATDAASRFDRRTLAWGGLVLAAVTLLAVNLLFSTSMRDAKIDLTADGLYTISQGTKSSLKGIDEPIDLRVYYSRSLGEAAPGFQRTFERIRGLLESYRDISGGKIRVSYFDPEPFSVAEDRAVAAGLKGIPLNQEGDLAYFGLVGTNSTDNTANIAFFSPQRDSFLEYDVTKLVHTLAHPKKKAIGLITSQMLMGGVPPMMAMRGMNQPLPAQVIMDQIGEFFEIQVLQQDVKEIPKDINVLMLAQADDLTPQAAFAIDQFVLGGGKVLVLIDPVDEMGRMAQGPMGGAMGPSVPGEIDKLLKAWGVGIDRKQVVGDISYARRVQFGSQGPGPRVSQYVPWLMLGKETIDAKDVLSAGVERLNMASAGDLTKIEGATTRFQPIVSSSDRAMLIDANKVTNRPDAVALLREYKIGGKKLTLAARVSGPIKTAFPDGPPKPKEEKTDAAKDGEKSDAKTADAAKADGAKAADDAAKDAKTEDAKAAKADVPAKSYLKEGRVNAIVVADTDMLFDQLWVDVRDFLGQKIAVPNASNNAFILGALDNLSGSDALISLRGRGVVDRPFTLVKEIRTDSERRFRDKEQTLTAKLKEVQGALAKLEKGGDGESLILTDKDRKQIDTFRTEMLSIRRDLRDVKLALKRDIDRLDAWLKFLNIAAVPLLIGIGGFGFAAWRRRRTSDR
jgi:ABC-type uncharacterized transport system involved in gliding motility auxiliary subunit